MKQFLTSILLLFAIQSPAQQLIHFKISEQLSVLMFLEAASGSPEMSPTLAEYIRKNIPSEDKQDFVHLLEDFRNIQLSYNYTIPGYPESRPRPRSTMDLIIIAAVHAEDEADFMDRIMGVLPNETWLRLGRIMSKGTEYYQKILGKPCQKQLSQQLHSLQQYDNQLDGIFTNLSHFYGSTWQKSIPFTVAIYPVPGKRGSTSATPHSNSLVLAVLTEETDHDMRLSVAVHEICHVLYGEQPLHLQFDMDKWFATSSDPNATFACNYFDEGMATACGNGWAYEQLSGKTNATDWYNNEYINTYGHALYPLVKEYIAANKSLDSAFVQKAIALFSAKFPNAYKNYQNLLNKVNIYTDADTYQDFGDISGTIRNHHVQVSSSSGSYPISESLQQLDQATGTQLIIVYKDHAANYALLTAKFPELATLHPDQEGIISFFDKNKRPIIIINAKDKTRIDKAVGVMVKAREINPERIFVPID